MAAASLAVAAACSGGDGRSGEGPSQRATSSSDAPAGGAAPSASRPVAGGVLRVGVERPASLDPAAARTVPQSDAIVADLLFDGLTAFDAAAGEVVPAVAARWEASDDLRRWVFRLRPGARFADGSPVTADDVVFTLERARGQADGGSSATAVLLEVVSSVSAPDPGVVRVELTEPMATLPAVLSNPALGIVPRGFDGATEDVVGSGPFSVERRDGDVVTLRRAPGGQPGREAWVDGVELHLFDSVDGSYRAFRDGRLDWSLVPAEAAGERGVQLSPYQAVLFYGINVARPPLGDRRVREAIARAVDSEAIATQVYGSTLVPIDGVVPPGVAGAAASGRCGGGCPHDATAARRLVRTVFGEAGAGAPTLQVDFDAGGRQEEVAGGVAHGLQAAGFGVALRPHPFEAYPEFLVSGEQEVFRLGWTGGWPSADAYLVPLFRSGSAGNVLGFSVPEVDEALAAALAEADAEKRSRRLAAAERLVMERFPVVPIGQFQTAWVASERVRGLSVAVTGTFAASEVWLARE